jgi:hypothetical protein
MKAVERGVGGVLAGAASLELYTFAPRGVRRVRGERTAGE